jgi:hypothetical protein
MREVLFIQSDQNNAEFTAANIIEGDPVAIQDEGTISLGALSALVAESNILDYICCIDSDGRFIDVVSSTETKLKLNDDSEWMYELDGKVTDQAKEIGLGITHYHYTHAIKYRGGHSTIFNDGEHITVGTVNDDDEFQPVATLLQ